MRLCIRRLVCAAFFTAAMPAYGELDERCAGTALDHPLRQLTSFDALRKIISEQGYEMNRPSMLNIELDLDEEKSVTGVRVGGGVAITGRGEIFV